MKKSIILLLVLFLVTGCVNINNSSIDTILDESLKTSIKMHNVTSSGYNYYLPKGISIIKENSNNYILMDEDNHKYYLYIDIVSKYHNVESNYEEVKDVYYSKDLNRDKYFGYIEINEFSDRYFVEMMYNYSKIETYVDKDSLNRVIANISTILNSVSYNDDILNTLIGENVLKYNEETYDIFKTKRQTGDFLDYIELYDTYVDEDVKEEDVIDIKED